MKKVVAITGSNGTVGRALISQLNTKDFTIVPIDLPEHDASNLKDLIGATAGCDVLIHLAWKDLIKNAHGNTIDPINNQMTFNAYQAAVTNHIPRVIMGSSNHAHAHDMRDKDGKIKPTDKVETPNNPYGAEKLFMEALGRYYAHKNDLEVISLRIGNVNKENKPRPNDIIPRWMSYRDLGALVDCCITAKQVPNNFQIIYAVSKQAIFDWSNPFGFEPFDSN